MAKEGNKHPTCIFGVQRYPGICSTGRGILLLAAEAVDFLIDKCGVLYTMYQNSRYIIRYETCVYTYHRSVYKKSYQVFNMARYVGRCPWQVFPCVCGMHSEWCGGHTEVGSLPRVYIPNGVTRPWDELEVVRNNEAVTYRGRGGFCIHRYQVRNGSECWRQPKLDFLVIGKKCALHDVKYNFNNYEPAPEFLITLCDSACLSSWLSCSYTRVLIFLFLVRCHVRTTVSGSLCVRTLSYIYIPRFLVLY